MQKQSINIPISEVTLLEDRAQVKRLGKIELAVGQTSLVIDKVAPILSDKTLLIKFSDTTPQIIDTKIRRQMKVRDKDKPHDVAQLEKKLEKINDQKDSLNRDRIVLEARLTSLEQILQLTFTEIPEDIAWGNLLDEERGQQISNAEDELLELTSERLKMDRTLWEIEEKSADLQNLLASLCTPATYHNAAIEFEVTTEKAGQYEVSIEYLVPNACWRPKHKAELLENKINFEMEGCVWQNTGEDWNDVQLLFSTQRSSLGAEPPLMEDDTISIQKKPKEEVIEIREEQIQDVGLGQSCEKSPDDLPGIDDGGEVQTLRAVRKATVPSNGCPYRMSISTFSSPTEHVLIMLPELAQYAFIRSDQENTMPHPVLAGPVDLVHNHGYVGRTSVLYVAPQEKFKLGWGTDPELRVNRIESSKTDEAKLLGSWHTQHYTIRLLLSNLGENEKTFTIRERIPISEIEKVKIEFDNKETTTPTKPVDENGMLEWARTLKPFAHEEIVLKYKVKTHKAVVEA